MADVYHRIVGQTDRGDPIIAEGITDGIPDSTTVPVHRCQYCGSTHLAACPRIKAIEYHPNGTTKRVELR